MRNLAVYSRNAIPLVAATLCIAACSGSIPEVHTYSRHEGYKAERFTPPDGQASDESLQGRHYCRHLEHEARATSVDNGIWAWLFTSASVGSGIVGTALVAATPDGASNTRKGLNVALPAATAALGLVAKAFFDRSGAAEELAALAARQAGQSDPDRTEDRTLDRQAHRACAEGTADWIADRTAGSQRVLEQERAPVAEDAGARDSADSADSEAAEDGSAGDTGDAVDTGDAGTKPTDPPKPAP